MTLRGNVPVILHLKRGGQNNRNGGQTSPLASIYFSVHPLQYTACEAGPDTNSGGCSES